MVHLWSHITATQIWPFSKQPMALLAGKFWSLIFLFSSVVHLWSHSSSYLPKFHYFQSNFQLCWNSEIPVFIFSPRCIYDLTLATTGILPFSKQSLELPEQKFQSLHFPSQWYLWSHMMSNSTCIVVTFVCWQTYLNLNLILPVLFVATNIGSCDSVRTFLSILRLIEMLVLLISWGTFTLQVAWQVFCQVLCQYCAMFHTFCFFLHLFTFLHVLCTESHICELSKHVLVSLLFAYVACLQPCLCLLL